MAADSKRRDDDVALLCGPTEDRAGVRVLRARQGKVEAGEVRPARDGQPLHGELVKLSPREKAPMVCDVEVLHRPEPAATPEPPAKAGPAMVSTDAYRTSWDRIFGARRTPADDEILN